VLRKKKFTFAGRNCVFHLLARIRPLLIYVLLSFWFSSFATSCRAGRVPKLASWGLHEGPKKRTLFNSEGGPVLISLGLGKSRWGKKPRNEDPMEEMGRRGGWALGGAVFWDGTTTCHYVQLRNCVREEGEQETRTFIAGSAGFHLKI